MLCLRSYLKSRRHILGYDYVIMSVRYHMLRLPSSIDNPGLFNRDRSFNCALNSLLGITMLSIIHKRELFLLMSLILLP